MLNPIMGDDDISIESRTPWRKASGKPEFLGRGTRRGMRQLALAFPFLAPNLIGFLLFTLLPILASILISLTEWDLLTDPQFVGLNNYVKLIGFSRQNGIWVPNDPDFWKYLWNTFFLMISIPIGMAASLILAVLLNNKIKGAMILRSIYFLPSMCVPIAVYLLWRWLYNPDYGLINWLLSLAGIDGPEWITKKAWSKPALIIAGLWAGVGGYNMIIYLAALQNIPGELYEAATIDGAGSVQKFRQITLPLLAPTTFFIAVMSVINGLQGGFDSAYIITGGGPAGSTTTLMYYIYNNAFEWSKMGYAATISWVLFVLIFAMTLLNWKIGGRHGQWF